MIWTINFFYIASVPWFPPMMLMTTVPTDAIDDEFLPHLSDDHGLHERSEGGHGQAEAGQAEEGAPPSLVRRTVG